MNVPTAAPAERATSATPVLTLMCVKVPIQPPTRFLAATRRMGWQGCRHRRFRHGVVTGTGLSRTCRSYFDPQGVARRQPEPACRIRRRAQTNGWNNFGFAPSTPQNRWEVTGKVTYAFNDNNKLWGSYTLQKETDYHPLSIWWAPDWTIPYPAEPVGKETAHVYLANFTHVFSATTTNEFVFRVL